MQPLDSREALFKHYQTSSDKEWDNYIQSLTVPPHAVTQPLYHMSFTEVPDGLWSPKKAVRGEASSEAHPIYGEMLPERISVSTSLEGCWAGIFCYLRKDPTVPKEITAFIYKATPQRGCRILTTETLSNYYLIQDAHLTDEYCLLGDVQMSLERTLTVKNTLSAPESKWIKDNPFKQKRYGNMHYPPFVILSNEPIQQESPMTALKLNFSNEMLHNQLSLEASANPLGMLAEGMTTKFSVLLTQLNKTNAHVSSLVTKPLRLTKPRKLRHITDKNNYMQLMNYGVAVPPGFIGPITPYMMLLAESLNLFKNIRRDITKPVAMEIGTILANPDRLRSASISSLTKINFYTKERTAFNQRVASYYNPKSTRDEIAFSRIFNDNAEFLDAGIRATELEHLLNNVNLELAGVLEDVGIISALTDKLAVRLVQDKLTYGVNAMVARDLAITITNTAESVGFLGALIAMAEESIGIIDNLVKKIN